MIGDISAASEIYIVTGLYSGYFYPHHFQNTCENHVSIQKDEDKNL